MFKMNVLAAVMALAVSSAFAADFGVTGLDSNPVMNAPAEASSGWQGANKDAATAATEALQQASPDEIINRNNAIAAAGAYTLGAGDKVRMTVYGEEELSGEFVVDSTGVLSLPLIGEVNVAGKTLRDAEKMVFNQLNQGYLVNPRVNLEVMNFRPFFILGEVNKPGSYPYVDNMTVINAVALGGGYTTRAKTGSVLLKRTGMNEGKESKVPEDTKVFPGDVIRVDERFF